MDEIQTRRFCDDTEVGSCKVLILLGKWLYARVVPKFFVSNFGGLELFCCNSLFLLWKGFASKKCAKLKTYFLGFLRFTRLKNKPFGIVMVEFLSGGKGFL